MSNHTTQEEVDHLIIEGMIRLLFPVLKHILGPWTFTRAYVNDFLLRARIWKEVMGRIMERRNRRIERWGRRDVGHFEGTISKQS